MGTNELKIEQFVEGLRPEIFRDVTVNEAEGITFSRVVEQALKAERAQSKIEEATKEKEAKEREAKEKEIREKEEKEKQKKMSFSTTFQPAGRFQSQWNRNKRRFSFGGQGQGQGQSQRQGQGQGQGHGQGNRGNQVKRFRGNPNQGQSFMSFQKSKCPKYGRFHIEVCMDGPGTCYWCGKMGHFAKDCRE